jgi:hypothetical protein
MNNEQKPMELLKESVPEIKAILALNARPGVDVDTMALQELENLRLLAITKPEIMQCMPQSVLLALKMVLKQNLTLDPYAGLIYIKTRNVKVGTDDKGQDVWKKALEIQPSANGLISIARQCGRILDIKRPEVQKDPQSGKVTSVTVEILLPSTPSPRWETFKFDTDDFYRWQRASHKENGRNKKDASAETLNYANDNYTNWKGGLDPEFARAKAIRHALKKLGTNQNEIRMDKIAFAPSKTIIIDAAADEAANNDESPMHVTEDAPHVEVSSKSNIDVSNISL